MRMTAQYAGAWGHRHTALPHTSAQGHTHSIQPKMNKEKSNTGIPGKKGKCLEHDRNLMSVS